MRGGGEESIKVVVVGDGGVGKTCLLRRFVRGDFVEQYRKTIGAEFMEKDVYLCDLNMTVKLMLWDTAGQEVFDSLTQAYYRGAGAAIVLFSTVDRDSFMSVESWKRKVEAVCGPITMVLCQAKFDLEHLATVSAEEAEQLASRLMLPFFRVSTRDQFNVTQVFEFAARQCMEAYDRANPEELECIRSRYSEVAARNTSASGEAAGDPSALTDGEPRRHEESSTSSHPAAFKPSTDERRWKHKKRVVLKSPSDVPRSRKGCKC